MTSYSASSWRRRAAAFAALVLVLGLAACYPGGPESLDEIGLVISFQNPDTDYAGLHTYAMEDTVAVLDNGDGSAQSIDRQYNAVILQELQDNLAARGFTREMDPQNNKPDVWVAVGAVESEVWVYWYDWGYWGGYYPPGWGGGYYPTTVSGASYQQGSIIWQMLDLRDVADPGAPGVRPPVMWLAGINGAIKSSNSANEAAIESGVAKAFEQSPYIVAVPPAKRGGQEVQP